MRKYCCMSVLGGWQTCHNHTGKVFGPIFNRINDLWDWQKDNLGIDAYDYNPDLD